MKEIPLRLKFTWFLFILSFSVYAQEPAYRNYTTSDGLTSNNVYSVMQDNRGFIWFGTDNGVSCFDGTRFKNYTIADGLSDNSVLRIAEDAQGRLWFLTFNGKLSFYQNNKIYNSSNCEFLQKIKFTDFITCFYQDSKKNIWICSMDNTVVVLSPSNELKIYKNFAKVIEIWEDQKGDLRFVSSGGVRLLHRSQITFSPYNIPCSFGVSLSNDSLLVISPANEFRIWQRNETLKKINYFPKYQFSGVSGLTRDRKKNIWITTLSGAIEFKNGIISSENEFEYLKNYSITSVFRDRDNNLWFSSFAKGVFIIPSTAIYLFNEKSGLVENDISAAAFINDTSLLLGYNNGSLQILNPSGVKEFGRSLVAPTGRVLQIEQDKNGTIWILTEGAVYNYRNGTLTKLNLIDPTTWYKTLFIERDGTVWIGWGRGIKKIINSKIVFISNKNITNRVYAIEQLHDYDTDLLLGTDKGLFIFKDGKLSPNNYNNPLLTYRISALAYTSDSTLWIGTNDHGLLSFRSGVVTPYTVTNHMLSNHCNGLLVDGNKIYVATDNGLNVVSKETNSVQITSYSIDNGLISNHINQIVKKDKNTLILATDRGIVEFDERELPSPSISTPYISAIVVNDTPTTNHTFNYSENNVRVDFGAVNFNSAGNINYRYKLEGIDANWNYTTYTSVKYSYLHPGNYTFIVATQNADGSWSPATASISFYILTPWWQTWWFRLVAGIIFIGIISLVIRWRISVYKEKITRDRSLAESELKALRAQINPHFIYNSLNAIQDFILQNQKEDANLYLSKFATLMRSILSHSRSSTVSLEEEIASLQLYLELEALRFNNHFTFQFIVDEKIDTEYVQIPSMILQPYIENAILHGLAPLPVHGKIIISFSVKNNFLVCVIEDNGIGRKKAAEARSQRVWKGHKSLGMTVTQERIDLLSSQHKQKINMEITDLVDADNNGTGTRVTIYFPLTD